MEAFLKYQQDILDPADYLRSWGRHTNLRNDLINQNNLKSILSRDVKPDLKLKGTLTVVSEEDELKMDQR